jgi:hypothetical protein
LNATIKQTRKHGNHRERGRTYVYKREGARNIPAILLILADARAVAVTHAVFNIQGRKGGRKKFESKVNVAIIVGPGWLAALSFEVGRGVTAFNAAEGLEW